MMECFSMAARTLRKRRLRSGLTILAIVIGISSVIAITSVGEGIRIGIVERIRGSGDMNIIDVHPGRDDHGNMIPITDSDIENIERSTCTVSVCPSVNDMYVTAGYNTAFNVEGVLLDPFIEIYAPSLAGGSFPDDADGTEKNTSVLLGHEVANKLRKREHTGLDSEFEAMTKLYVTPGGVVKNVTFRVVGILKEVGNDDVDNRAFVCLHRARELNERGDMYDKVIVKADDGKNAVRLKEKITDTGLEAHCLQEEIDSANRFMGVVTLVLGFFAAISLVVGALMIVNTMIITVHERTKEIGVMKAIGGSDRDIMKMFMAECLIIGAVGGILGILGGLGLSMLIDPIGREIMTGWLGAEGTFEHITAVTPAILAGAFALSMILSTAAGLYPAWKAAKLDPVEALRHG